jgi:carbamoyl-phosphate synthase large subunit
MSDSLNILISSAGRRVELIECFRNAAAELGCRLRVVATDAHPQLSAACHKADRSYQVPPCSDPAFVDRLLELCAAEKIALVVPTIDTELHALSASRDHFQSAGVELSVSSSDVIKIARDKLEMHRFLSALGIASPRTEPVDNVLREPEAWPLPLVLKPRGGSSSVGLHFAANIGIVRSANIIRADYIAQPFVAGQEYTVNLFFDGTGLRCAIPHRRLEIRGGEVSKAITERLPCLAAIATSLGRNLAGRARGALCFQAIVPDSGAPSVIDLNARFGGGYPLAHQAGANFVRWLLEPLLHQPSTANDSWQEGLAMVRYDTSLFFSMEELPSGPFRTSYSVRS